MIYVLLNAAAQSTTSIIVMWVLIGLAVVLLGLGILRQVHMGRRLRQELTDIEQLRQSTTEYEFVLKAMKIAIWHYDARTQAFVYEHDFREGLHNYVPDSDETFKDTLAAIDPADAERVNKAFLDIVEGHTETYHEEYRVLNKTFGTAYWEESYATIAERDADGKPLRIIGTSMRVDTRKELEVSLVAARNKAEESDRLKTAFLANMGHEIRTPLNAIVGFADLLPVVQSEEDRNQLISEIQTNNRKLLHIIDGLVSMSKIEAGAKSLMLAKVDVNQLLQSVVDNYQPTTNVQMITQFALPDLQIESDREKLQEIIDNLVQNAVKFTTEGIIVVGYDISGNSLQLFVSDSGKGIADADHERIFERFVKVDEYIPGTGVGLSVVKSHAASLGGSVSVESSLGVGSTFRVSIPLEQ
jgi:signal transduction histidine kinase